MISYPKLAVVSLDRKKAKAIEYRRRMLWWRWHGKVWQYIVRGVSTTTSSLTLSRHYFPNKLSKLQYKQQWTIYLQNERHKNEVANLWRTSMSKIPTMSDELAQQWDDGGTAVVVGLFGKAWRVEAGRDADGAFLGRGWPELAASLVGLC